MAPENRDTRVAFAGPGVHPVPATWSPTRAPTHLIGGSQFLRGVLYAEVAGSPGRRLATTSAVSTRAGRAPGRVTLTLPVGVGLQPGTPYRVGLHSGTTNEVARFAGTPVAGALRWSTDPYADGATSSFGAASRDSTRVSAFATGG